MKKNPVMARIDQYAGRYRHLRQLSCLLSALSALCSFVPFVYIWLAIREVLEVMPDYQNAVHLVHYGWMALLFSILALLIYVCALICSHLAAFRVQANIRYHLTDHLKSVPAIEYEKLGTGNLRKIIVEASSATETYLAHQLPDYWNAMATLGGLVVMLFLFDWKLGILCVIPEIIGFSLMGAMTGKRMEERMIQYNKALSDMSNEAVEYVRGIAVVKTFSQSLASFEQFRKTIDNYRKWVIAYTKGLRAPMITYITCINSVFALLAGAALYVSTQGVSREFILNFLFYIILTPLISLTLTRIMFLSENVMVVNDAFRQIDSILDLKPMKEPANPEKTDSSDIEFDHVRFAYDKDRSNAIDDVSFHIPAGVHAAIVGPSGSGKSTAAALAARLCDPGSGTIRIGGRDVRSISTQDLNDTVSFVFQDSKLIKGSILDNVRMARPDASREEVLRALSEAQCGDILEKLPDGADTVIGSEGIYVSGGEAQRIAIARAMLKDAPVLILDEATAYADPDNETRVQKAFERLAKDKTLLMIAHRLSTVAGADVIYVMEEGKIREAGSHEDLLKKNGLYARLWNEYQKSAAWKAGKNND